MLKIRLQRVGRRNHAEFRVVVCEHTTGPKSGKNVETLGSYNPHTNTAQINAERTSHWIGVGAQVSDTVHNLLVREGVIEGKKRNALPKKTVPQKEEPEETSAPATEAAASEGDGATEVATEEEEPVAATT
ncbi:30S ribosomal protein S16 [Patescibacteria group bacterium]|jgi:small subunit ribosomal protein S16|nr:30S ribosomal protein S16 [Patescibacteria group bacterium]